MKSMVDFNFSAQATSFVLWLLGESVMTVGKWVVRGTVVLLGLSSLAMLSYFLEVWKWKR